MEILLFAVLFSLIPAMVARSKGRDFLPWWTYGALLVVVALPHAILLKPEPKQLQEQHAASGRAAQIPEGSNSIRSRMALFTLDNLTPHDE